jgi:prepilin-type N-terminal cleavage/methylation domain-containing protein
LKNKGFTLIEIIIVVAILAIAGSIVWMSINPLFGFEAKKTAKYLFGAMEKTKVLEMTKMPDSWLYLYRADDGVYLDIYECGVKLENEYKDNNKIGSATITVTVTMKGGATETLDENGIVIAFNRSDGSFKTSGQAWDLQDPSYTPLYPGDYYARITISGGGTVRAITLYPNTGKIEYTL